MKTPPPPGRVNVPDAFNGPYSSFLIGTYGVDLDFLENHLLHGIPNRLRSRVILADATQLHTALNTGYTPRRTNRTYALAPVHAPHAFHVKFILLTGPEHGRLLVGSGNVSVGGYIGAGEAFTTYDFTPEDPSHASNFAAIRQFLQNLNQTYPIDDQAWNLIQDQLAQAAWIPENTIGSTITHNLHTTHLEQLAKTIGSDSVTEVVAYAPFHDRKAEGIQAIIDTLNPKRLTLLAQQKQTVLDVKATLRAVKPLGSKFSAHTVEAPDPYNPTYLHAKFLLVRTQHADHLLQGSANLSAVALNRAGTDANVEMCNLLTTEQGGFNNFIKTLNWQQIDELSDLSPADWSETQATDHTIGMIRDATWLKPKLTGTVNETIKRGEISVSLGGRTLTPTQTDITDTATGSNFALTFNTDDAHSIDSANSIEIAIRGHDTIVIYPYRVHDLSRMGSTGNRIDLLRNAGTLDLNDKEINEMLEVLDQVLIVDLQSAWKMAHPHTDTDTTDLSAEAAIKYEDIDWEAIRQHAVYKAYTGHNLSTAHSPTELGILLQALTDRFNQEASGHATTDDALDDLGTEQTVEDADAIDEANAHLDPDNEVEQPRSASNRAKRLWGNFAKRFVRGIQDRDFVDAVGPSVIVLSYAAFNHLLRLLRNRKLINEHVGHDCQTALWRFMWGTNDSIGYLETLPDGDRQIALKALHDNKDVPVTLTAIEDIYWHLWVTDQDITELRSIIRRLLESPDFQPTRRALDHAASVTTNLTVQTAASLVNELESLATGLYPSEVDNELAAALNLPYTSMRWYADTVNVDGRAVVKRTLHLPDDYNLTPKAATAALARWQQLEPNGTYRRMSAGKRMALQDDESGTALHYDRETDVGTPLNLNDAEVPVWVQRLHEWHALAA
jgi:hypothetical protein